MRKEIEIDRADIKPGMTIWVMNPEFGSGSGGTVKTNSATEIVLTVGTLIKTFPNETLSGMSFVQEVSYPREECISFDTAECRGEVEEHSSRSGMTSALRCSFHWNEHNDKLDHISRDFPDSPMAPSWFDPSYAGETWNEEY